ncbi:hypothetical protein [Bacillus sp. FJAT-29814]|uniref:hypothetical protein n=1 Tax=Bacillus sp. FJAT-29814 TaxID=1729688 RepID=UPI00082A586D|nr:hypothetical protein [Bacillus sp. FJAT-29814]
MRKIFVIVGFLLVAFVSGSIGKVTNVDAVSKVQLEEMVQKQQITIDILTAQLTEVNKQLSDTTKRLEALESKDSSTDGFEARLTKVENIIGEWDTELSVIQYLNDLDLRFNKRILALEKLSGIDDESIQRILNSIPQAISSSIKRTIEDDIRFCYSCTFPIQKEKIMIYNIGSFNFNILDYITVEEIKEIALATYNQQKSDKINYQYLSIQLNVPLNQTPVTIDIPLQ